MSNHVTREGFEWWDKFNALQRLSFLLGESDGGHPTVNRVPMETGLYIDQHEASELVDAMQAEINELKVEINALNKRLNMKVL